MPPEQRGAPKRISRAITVTLPLLQPLFEGLPNEQQTQEVYTRLKDVYQQEVSLLLAYALSPQCQDPEIVMYSWRQAGSQWIAEFFVADRSRTWKGEYNFHGQNTSQWLYAGAIVVENGQVSTHH